MTLLTHGCNNDIVMQLGPLGSDAMFEVVEVNDVFCAPSLAVFFTCCSQPDLKLANLEATVAANELWHFSFQEIQ